MGQKKLTLRLDEEIIERAKQLARERGDSVSGMTERYFRNLSEPRESGEGTSPMIARMRGIIREADREEYEEHLHEKYS